MVYQYIAYNESGKIIKGKMPAANEEMATELLGYAGYKTISLKPYVPFINADRLTAGLFRVKPNEIILFYRQMAMLLESGVDIVSSLDLLQEQSANRVLKRVIGEVITDIRGGNQLSAALDKHPRIFTAVYSHLLRIGEQSGDLESVLRQVADYMEREIETAKETKSALMYPVITSIITVVVIGVLVTFVLPGFSSLYGSLGVELPPMARIMINGASMIQANITYIVLGILAVLVLVYLYIRTPSGRYNRDKMILHLPILGHVIHLSELARYCRSMSLLFRSGLPLTEVISLLVQTSRNQALAEAFRDVQKDLIRGEGLSQPMSRNRLFLPMMVQMVKVGEETGNLDMTLLAVAGSYETEAKDSTRTLIDLIQPAMTLIIGVLIGLIALSLTTAMYSLYGREF